MPVLWRGLDLSSVTGFLGPQGVDTSLRLFCALGVR